MKEKPPGKSSWGWLVVARGVSSNHFHLHGNAHALLALLCRKVVEPLETDDAPPASLDKGQVVVGFLAHVFFLRIVEPHAERIALAVVIYPQLSRHLAP